MRANINLLLSLDVEEEGLFRRRYQCRGPQVRNVECLKKLFPILERGARPTFFCAYSVLTNEDALGALDTVRKYGEVGAHLHHWNTPPIGPNIPGDGILEAVPAAQLPLQCLDAKLEHLLEACRAYAGDAVCSFRMGRWDLHGDMLPFLQARGIKVDASVRPLHCFSDKNLGPDHFCAPRDPYWIPVNGEKILEVPLTVTPLLSPLTLIPNRAAWGKRLRETLRYWGALALLPVEHPLWLMKLTTNLHLNSGATTLSLTWHSSDLMPGGNPRLPDEAAVNAFIVKVSRYLDWLEHNFNVNYALMKEMPRIARALPQRASASADWSRQAPRDA